MKRAILWMVALAFFVSCSNDDDKAHLKVTMIDAPADYDKVLVDVQDVMISAKTGDESWVSIGGTATGQIDLLSLVGGFEAILADAEVPAGKINQLRLVLGDNNKLVIGEEEFDIKVPSGQESGLKLQIHKDFEAGVSYTIQLDFDAAKSIVEKGNGSYSLQPVLRSIVEAQSGSIDGSITNGAGALVSATDGTNTYNTYADEEGVFLLAGVMPGTYTVTISPAAESGLVIHTASAEVELGKKTTLEEITLEEAQ